MRYLSIGLSVLFAAALLSLNGCGPKKPDDFPNVAPATVTVTKDGAPIADVTVVLNPSANSISYAVAGETDSTGKAVISTRGGTYSANGAPAGSYIVTLAAKLPTPPSEVSFDERKSMDDDTRAEYDAKVAEELAEIKANNPIPSSLRNKTDAALEWEVPEGGADLTIEVSDYPHDPSVDAPVYNDRGDRP